MVLIQIGVHAHACMGMTGEDDVMCPLCYTQGGAQGATEGGAQ